MSRILKCFVGLLFIFSSSLSTAGPGFFDIESSEVPRPIRDLKQSVFQMIVFSREPENYIPASELAAHRRWIDSQLWNDTLKQIKHWEIDTYFDSEGGYSHSAVAGSAFLMSDNQTIGTNRSIFDGLGEYPADFSYARNYQEAAGAMNPFPFEIALIDHEGNLVFSSRRTNKGHQDSVTQGGFMGHVTALAGLGTSFQIPEYYALNIMTDFISFKISKTLPGRPLDLARQLPSLKSKVYVLSYPNKTSGGRGENESLGNGLYVSSGNRVEPPQGYQRVCTSQYGRLAASYLSTQLFHNADFSIGSLGAPVMDSAGNFVGVVTNSWAKNPLVEYSDDGGYGVCSTFVLMMQEAVRKNPNAQGIYFPRRN